MNDENRLKPMDEGRLELLAAILDGKQDYNATIQLTKREQKYLHSNGYCGFCRSKCKGGEHYISSSVEGY